MRRCAANRLGASEAAADQLLRLQLIETRIVQVDDQQPLCPDEIQLRTEPAQLLLCMRETVTSFAKLRSLLRHVADSAYGSVPAEVLGKFMIVLHAREFELERLEVQIGFVMQQPFAAAVPLPDGRVLRIEELPGVALLAAYVRTGLAEHAHLATARLARFIEANDYRLAGPGREVFCARDAWCAGADSNRNAISDRASIASLRGTTECAVARVKAWPAKMIHPRYR